MYLVHPKEKCDALSRKLGDSWWKQNLRMSQDTFNILCNELLPYYKVSLDQHEISSECSRICNCHCLEAGNEY